MCAAPASTALRGRTRWRCRCAAIASIAAVPARFPRCAARRAVCGPPATRVCRPPRSPRESRSEKYRGRARPNLPIPTSVGHYDNGEPQFSESAIRLIGMRSKAAPIVIVAVWALVAAPWVLADDLADLAREFWSWRAATQPFSGDDVPRLERPAETPDWSRAAIEARRGKLAEFEKRWEGLDASGMSVLWQVDRRLMGSAIARVRWEIEILRSMWIKPCAAISTGCRVRRPSIGSAAPKASPVSRRFRRLSRARG